MEIIENFAELSFDEQKAFAETFVKTLNSEHTFTDTAFRVTGVEADDLAGDLVIFVEPEDTIEVSREATWTSADEEDMHDDPGYEADYTNALFEDAQKAFKTLSVELEGYKVTLAVDDVDEEDTIEVEVENYSHEDAGIGSYEYWGHDEYDSRPYVEVEGNIVKACTCYISLYVEPVGAGTEPEVQED